MIHFCCKPNKNKNKL